MKKLNKKNRCEQRRKFSNGNKEKFVQCFGGSNALVALTIDTFQFFDTFRLNFERESRDVFIDIPHIYIFQNMSKIYKYFCYELCDKVLKFCVQYEIPAPFSIVNITRAIVDRVGV